jgi:transposase
VLMATTSGFTLPQLSSDLGVGASTLNKRVQQHQHADLMSSATSARRSDVGAA